MLVLSRKIGEKIVIGDDVIVSIEDIRGPRIVLGITAPRDKLVLRMELLPPEAKRIVDENAA